MKSLSGLLLIDKDQGMTSHDVVDRLRNILNMRAIGHAGTLDPMATGLLICMVGEATKLSQYVMAEDKSYKVDIKLGVVTDTADVTGKVIEQVDASHITLDDVLRESEKLVGLINLKVPKYSAVKISGKKLYEYARENEEVELPSREMLIKSISSVSLKEQVVSLEMDCGKGTYVRSWAEKLGENLKVGGTVQSLRRLSSGPFKLNEAVTLATLGEQANLDFDQCLAKNLVSMKDVLRGWPSVKLSGRDPLLVSNGQIPHGILAQLRVASFPRGVRLLNDTGGLLALMVKDENKGMKLARVFRP
jgi:tRNA pseudouridine55 synthase